MLDRLQRFKPELLGLMRIATAVTFLEHGTQKLMGFPVPPPSRLALPLLIFTGVVETLGSILVALGVWRLAALATAVAEIVAAHRFGMARETMGKVSRFG